MIAVIILSGLMVLALIALVVGCASIPTLPGGGKTAVVRSRLRVSRWRRARVSFSMDSQPGKADAAHSHRPGEEIDILDTQNGHLVGQVKAVFEK